MQITSSEFISSYVDYRKCPPPDKPEFAFIGRSNVGKSSLINMLCSRKKLAKTSSTPGKTQTINHYLINNSWYLVDLPGYGYAKTSRKARESWELMIKAYFINRTNMVLCFVLVDIRLEPQKLDTEMINWFGQQQIPISILFTKLDKVSRQTAIKHLELFEKNLLSYWENLPLRILTSANTRSGKEDILTTIETASQSFSLTRPGL